MKLWKALGVAGLAGVATTGVILARNQRARAQLTPDEVRARLQQRWADAQETTQETAQQTTREQVQASTDSNARA